MKYLYFIVLYLGGVSYALAQAPDFAWARQINGTASSVLAMDEAGNSYMAGVFPANSTVNIGGITLNGSGSPENGFIAKFSPNGTAQWAKRVTRIGGLNGSAVDRMVVDGSGNVYLAGGYLSGATIDGQTLPGNYGYFVVCLNAAGSLQWTRIISTEDNVGSNISVVLAQDGIRVIGLFNTKVFFSATDSIVNTGSQTGVDAFTATYDVGGNLLERRELGVVNPSFNPNTPYPAEIFRFEKASGILYRFVPQIRTFAKYNSAGTSLFTKTIACSGATPLFTSMAVDKAGNFFFGGAFYSGSLTVEGTLVPKFGNGMYTDAILLQFDANGIFRWVRQYQYLSNDSYMQVRADEIGNVYAIGQHAAIGGDSRAIMTKFSTTGDLLWEQLIVPGPGAPNDPAGVVVPENILQAHNGGNILVLGYFKERIYFDPSTSFSSAGVYKIFLAQYGVCNTPILNIDAPETSFCAGDSVQLTAASVSNQYAWNTGDSSESIYVSQSGSYYVLAVEDSECYAQSPTVVVNEVPLPQVTVTQTGITLTAETTESTLQWLDCTTGFSPVSGATQAVFVPNQNGSYAVAVSNAQGCADTSACFLVNTLGVIENQANQHAVLFPNPTRQLLQVSGVDVSGAVIYTLFGQQVLALPHASPWDVSSLAPGTYFVEAQTPQGIWRKKFVKE